MRSKGPKSKARRPPQKQSKTSNDKPEGVVPGKGPESRRRHPPAIRHPNETKADSIQDRIRQKPENNPLEPTYAASCQSIIDTPTARVQRQQVSIDTGTESTRARLTRKNLKMFNKMTKNKGRKRVSPSDPLDPDYTQTTPTVSTLSSRFPAKALQNGILGPSLSRPPENLEEIRKQYAHSRGTASPTRSMYSEYVNTVQGDANEATIVTEVSSQLFKKPGIRGYGKAFNRAVKEFPEGVGFNNGLSAPRPDYVEGLRMYEFHPLPVVDNIQGAVLHGENPYSITLPHLAGEFKGTGKDLLKGELQSAYAGAALVYGRNQALSYLEKPDAPRHAEISTFTTDGTTLNLFANYADRTEDGSLQYHQYPVQSIKLTDSHQAFKEGRKALRNAQDHARELSYDLRDRLKEVWRQRRNSKRTPQPVAEGTSKGMKRPVVTPQPVADGTSKGTKKPVVTPNKVEKTTKVLSGRVTRPPRRQLRYNLRSSK